MLHEEPQIEIESTPRELRITIPKTARAIQYYRRAVAARSAFLLAPMLLCAAAPLADIRNVTWDVICWIWSLAFGGALVYSLQYPDRVNLFKASTAIVQLDETTLHVTTSEHHRTRQYPRHEISAIQAQRCDFSRCGKIVVSVKRNGRRFKNIIAVYSELQPLKDVASRLRAAIGIDGTHRQA
jgi:hypothetical protein